MHQARRLLGIAFLSGALLVAAATPAAADPKSPAAVNMGLKILAGVYGDMDRKLAAGQYDRLPHENQEFQEGSGALKDAVAHEPAPFKEKVEATLKTTLSAATHVADASASHDQSKVKAALEALATALRNLNALFPESLRAEPGTVAPGRPH
ncbi:MAG TPA: hypothetical protein VGM84_25670 [Steroidobacteraceae bacterium]|jgi:hypothetical protein